MTKEEIDAMWQQAMRQSIEKGEMFTRYCFAALVAAAKDAEHKEAMRWDIHSCGPTCKRYACVAVREAVAAENKACADRASVALLGASHELKLHVIKAIRTRSNP